MKHFISAIHRALSGQGLHRNGVALGYRTNPACVELLESRQLLSVAPTGLLLSHASIAEHSPSGTAVGAFTAVDPDAGDTLSYQLVDGVGSGDNAKFQIVGDQLQTSNDPLNFEVKRNYSILVSVKDQTDLSFTKAFTIRATNINEAPTSVNVSPKRVAEHKPVGTVVGVLSATDPDANTTFVYSLVDGGGVSLAADNAAFKLVLVNTAIQLQTRVQLNYEVKSTYNLVIRAKDQRGLFCDQPITINVRNINEAPIGMSITSTVLGNPSTSTVGTTIAENQPASTVVGTLSATDPDFGATFSYSLVNASGVPLSADNAPFKLVQVGADIQLQTKVRLNYEVKRSYLVVVRATDQGGLFYDKTLRVKVTNVNEAPTAIALSSTSVGDKKPALTVVGTLLGTDPDAGTTLTYSLDDGSGNLWAADNQAFVIVGNQLKTSRVLNCVTKSSYSIKVRATDQYGLFRQKAFTILVTQPSAVGRYNGSYRDSDYGTTGSLSMVIATQSGQDVTGTITGDGQVLNMMGTITLAGKVSLWAQNSAGARCTVTATFNAATRTFSNGTYGFFDGGSDYSRGTFQVVRS